VFYSGQGHFGGGNFQFMADTIPVLFYLQNLSKFELGDRMEMQLDGRGLQTRQQVSAPRRRLDTRLEVNCLWSDSKGKCIYIACSDQKFCPW
jgi:hypothetical protein